MDHSALVGRPVYARPVSGTHWGIDQYERAQVNGIYITLYYVDHQFSLRCEKPTVGLRSNYSGFCVNLTISCLC